MSEVGNIKHPYCEKWDKLLNILMKEGEVIGLDSYRITFKLKVGEETVNRWFGLSTKTKPVYNVYEVWIENRKFSYSHLDSLNGKRVSNCSQRKPSQETMNKLHQLETKLLSGELFVSEDIYSIPAHLDNKRKIKVINNEDYIAMQQIVKTTLQTIYANEKKFLAYFDREDWLGEDTAIHHLSLDGRYLNLILEHGDKCLIELDDVFEWIEKLEDEVSR